MGHAVYQGSGGDYSAEVACPFSDPEEALRFDPAEEYGIPDHASLVRSFEERYAAWIGRHFAALADADVPVVMVHDDIVWTSGPFIHPDWYRRYVFPAYRRFFASLRESGKRILYTSDGNYTAFIGNVDTRILLSGSREEIRAEVERCMRIGKNCPGFFLAVGNHIPPNTPVENALYYNEVYEATCRR